ncbi:MAG: SH3 domain-containing protein [Candidatus Acidiferrales bacterium]
MKRANYGRPGALTSVLASMLCLLFSCGAFGQAAPAEKTFNAPKASVDKALQSLRSSTSGRLPTLDGFVDSSEPLEHYERGFFQCAIVATAAPGGGTSVRVGVKITAWYADPSGARSGYRVLPSNGRIESDFLNGLGDALGAKAGGSVPSSRVGATGASGAAAPEKTKSAPVSPSAPPSSARPTAPVASSTPTGDGKSSAVLANESLASIRQKRETDEQQFRDLSGLVQNLEQIKQNQTHPDDISVVKKTGTAIYAKPQTSAEVLMTADEGDEFPILDAPGGWVHVQISGPSRGWIREVQLDMPSGFANGAEKSATESDAAPLFRVSREDISPFAGTWGLLKDKVVKIIWVAPIDPSAKATTAQAKREYAKSLFLKAYREISADPAAVAGVVVVFDSADGGQVSATLMSLKKLRAGYISDDDFWKECSLEPPESFQDAPQE